MLAYLEGAGVVELPPPMPVLLAIWSEAALACGVNHGPPRQVIAMGCFPTTAKAIRSGAETSSRVSRDYVES